MRGTPPPRGKVATKSTDEWQTAFVLLKTSTVFATGGRLILKHVVSFDAVGQGLAPAAFFLLYLYHRLHKII